MIEKNIPFIDYFDSPYFYTMTDVITDYQPEYIVEFPVIEQDNVKGGKKPIKFGEKNLSSGKVPSLFDKANMKNVRKMRLEIVK